jgi:hypothetical protein
MIPGLPISSVWINHTLPDLVRGTTHDLHRSLLSMIDSDHFIPDPR